MSAIGGVYGFDGAPASGGILIALGQGLASRGPDGGGHFKSGSIGMVYRAFHTTRESRLERQPLASSLGHILCWDGRLDNREELTSILRDRLSDDRTDADIVMAAYIRWGIDFLPRIVGDFVLSLWDPISKWLVLARDVIGSHDLYYHRNENRVIWSSHLGLLIELSEEHLAVDDDYVAGYLTRGPEPWQTPFKRIDSVPPAHAMVIESGQSHLHRFWGLDPKLEIRYRTDGEYEEHFRHLFREAVRCCLRAGGPVWADLSGGLDSSSIVCMADQLINNGEADATTLETVSCIRDESPSSNETKFIRYVESHIGREGYHLPESDFPVLSASFSEPSIIPNALDIFASYHKEVNKLMVDRGARVRLCGNGGDEILNSVPDPSPELTDLLVRGDLLKLHRCLRAWSFDRRTPYMKLFWQDALLPVLPRELQVALGHQLLKRLPDWFDPQFVKRTNLRERMLGPSDSFGFKSPSNRSQCIAFLSSVKGIAAGYVRVLQDIEIRLPMLHRPLVEFMQAIPRDQRARLGETRSLQRRALRNLLPAEILRRKGKGNPIEALFRAVSREYPRLHSVLSDSYVCRYGYVNQRALTAALERSRYGDQGTGWILRIISLEFWLRSLERRRPQTKISTAVMGSPEALRTAVGEAFPLREL